MHLKKLSFYQKIDDKKIKSYKKFQYINDLKQIEMNLLCKKFWAQNHSSE